MKSMIQKNAHRPNTESKMIQVTVRTSLRDAIAEEMRKDQDVFIIGEEVAEYQGAYKITKGLLQEFGEKRVIDTPITEHGFTGLCVGAAFSGLKPILEFMTFNFSMQAIDHIINSAAKTHYMSGGQICCPIVFRGPNGVASRVAAQHSQCFASWYSHCPGLKVIAPYHAMDFKGLLKSAIRDPNPIIFLESELLYGKTFDVLEKNYLDTEYLIPIGKASVIQEGNDVTIVSFSNALSYVIDACSEIKNNLNKSVPGETPRDVSIEIIDLRTIKPLDIDTIIKSLSKTHKIIVVEEGWPFSGIGAEVISQVCNLAFDELDAEPIRVTGEDVPLPYAENLEKLALPSVDKIINAIKRVCC